LYMRKRTPIRLRKSFTLIELVLATLMLIFVLVALASSFLACSLLNEASRNLLIATSHAQYVMEEIKNKASTTAGFTELTSAYVNTTWNWSTPAAINTKGLIALRGESIQTTLVETTYKDVLVTVNWQDQNNRGRHIDLETIITRP